MIRTALKFQYHAALKTLREAIEQCPDRMWNDPADATVPFWRVAYHTLFFAHFYLQQDRRDFKPWARTNADAHWESLDGPRVSEGFTRADLLEYWQVCDGMMDSGVDALDLSAAQCGFPWYKMGTLEHQLVNIRHIQHHAAMLSARLREKAGIGIDWFGRA